MDINQAFPSKFLSAADLQGHTVEVTIDRVEMETMGQDSKPVVYFRGKQKGLVLNKTNANIIANQHGNDTDAWTGKTIKIYPTFAEFKGQQVPAIRVKMSDAEPPPADSEYDF